MLGAGHCIEHYDASRVLMGTALVTGRSGIRRPPISPTPSRGDVGLITLDRPEARNALTWQMYAELERIVRSTTALPGHHRAPIPPSAPATTSAR